MTYPSFSIGLTEQEKAELRRRALLLQERTKVPAKPMSRGPNISINWPNLPVRETVDYYFRGKGMPQPPAAKRSIEEAKTRFRQGTNPVTKVVGALGALDPELPENASTSQKALQSLYRYDPGVLFGGISSPKSAQALEKLLGGFGLQKAKNPTEAINSVRKLGYTDQEIQVALKNPATRKALGISTKQATNLFQTVQPSPAGGVSAGGTPPVTPGAGAANVPPPGGGGKPPVKPPKPAPIPPPSKNPLKDIQQALRDAYNIQKGKRTVEKAQRVGEARKLIDVENPQAMRESTQALAGQYGIEPMVIRANIPDTLWDDLRLQIVNRKDAKYFDQLNAARYVDAVQMRLADPTKNPPPVPSLEEAFNKLFPETDITKLARNLTEEELMAKPFQSVTQLSGPIGPSGAPAMQGTIGLPPSDIPATGRLNYQPTGKLGLELQGGQMAMGAPPYAAPPSVTHQGLSDLEREFFKREVNPLPQGSGKGTYAWGPEAPLVSEAAMQESLNLYPNLGAATQVLSKAGLAEKQLKQLDMLPKSKLETLMHLVKQVGNGAMDAGELLRTVQAGFLDLSFNGRQGLILSLMHPIAGAKSFARNVRAFGSAKFADEFNRMVTTDPDVLDVLRRNGYLAPLDPGSVTRALREESMPSRLAGKLPGTKQTSRAFATAANSIRYDYIKSAYKAMRAFGASEADYNEFAKLLNILTGRGNLPQKLEPAAGVLNALLFSPKLLMSRIQLPAKLASQSPFVRKEAAKALGSLIGFTTMTLGIAYLMGAKVETDPRSAAFGKLRIGNSYYDLTGGYAQYARTLARMFTGTTKQPGGDIAKKSALESATQFLQSKESPIFSLVTDLMAGQTYGGEKIEFTPGSMGKQVVNRMTPLALQEIVSAMVDDGILGGLKATPEIVGVGTVTYPEPPPSVDFANASQLEFIKSELSDHKVKIGRVGETLSSLKLTPDETEEFQRLAGQLVGQYINTRMNTSEYQMMGKAEQAQDLQNTANRAKDAARLRLIMDSGITEPHRGDSPTVALQRRDLALVGRYMTAMQGINNTRARQVIGNAMKSRDSQLETALILSGYASVTQDTTEGTLRLLSRRRNGGLDELPSSFSMQGVEQLRQFIEPYYQIEDRIWGMYPPQVKAMADEISDLENGDQADQYKARAMLKSMPAIVRARSLIAQYKKRMRMNRELDSYIRAYA